MFYLATEVLAVHTNMTNTNSKTPKMMNTISINVKASKRFHSQMDSATKAIEEAPYSKLIVRTMQNRKGLPGFIFYLI
jgi:hypothetical protein